MKTALRNTLQAVKWYFVGADEKFSLTCIVMLGIYCTFIAVGVFVAIVEKLFF